MTTHRSMFVFAALLASIAGCDRQVSDGPPVIRLGDSVCDQCDMIISDDRWATATIIEGPRGPEPRLFDDFNCQVNHQVEHPELAILARWSHDHATSEWLPTEQAWFLISPGLRTPMGSKAAAFSSPTVAETAKAELDGEVMAFEIAWERLGFVGAGSPADVAEAGAAPEEHNDGP